MKIFSKRYSMREFVRLRNTYGRMGGIPITKPGISPYRSEFLESSTRIRLSQQINFLVSNGEYTEPFLLTRYGDSDKFFLSGTALQVLSYHELGYDITEYFSSEDLVPMRIQSEDGKFYHDKYLLDIVELMIIFAIKDKREEVIKRFQRIFQEEKSDILIYGHMLVIQDIGGLQSVASLLNDPILKEKLEDILVKRVTSPIAAREAADITQRVFSGVKKGDTKEESEKIIESISLRWIKKEDKKNFSKLMNTFVKTIKDINNQIADIRHTDKDRIDFGTPDIFKMIKNLNLAISELAILTTQDQYIEKENAETLKLNYLEEYNVQNQTVIIPVSSRNEPVNYDDIPF